MRQTQQAQKLAMGKARFQKETGTSAKQKISPEWNQRVKVDAQAKASLS
jgi:hypothetical protein